MRKVFDFFFESLFWLQIFLCPVIVSALLGFIIYIKWPDLLPAAELIVVAGVVAGVLYAERIRRKYGCSGFLSRIRETPDIWPVNDEVRKKQKECESGREGERATN